jgi:hypothetical protein
LEHSLLDICATNPAQHLDGCPKAVLSVSMRPMRRRVEELDEGGMLLLDLLQRGCLLEAGIRYPQLNLELRLDQVLPGLALLDVTHLDAQVLEQSFIDF